MTKVWIESDLCTGDGLCEEIAPEVFKCSPTGNGLWVVWESKKYFGQDMIFDGQDLPGHGSVDAAGLARIPDDLLDAAIEAAEECPGSCIYIEVE